MTFVVLALFGSTLVGIVRVGIALVGIAPVGIGTCTHHDHIGWNASKIISGQIAYGTC